MKHLFTLILVLSFNLTHADVRISDIGDITGQWNGDNGNTNYFDQICVFSDSGLYHVTATGSGAGGDFTLNNGVDDMEYQFRWNDIPNANSGNQRINPAGSTITGQTGADTVSTDCNSGADLNARMIIRVRFNDLIDITPGTYTGTVTITIGPE